LVLRLKTLKNSSRQIRQLNGFSLWGNSPLKRILFSNVLQKSFEASIWVSIAIPSSPHEFLQVLQQKVRIAITLHDFEFGFRRAPVTFGVLCVDARGWVDKVERMIDSSVVQT